MKLTGGVGRQYRGAVHVVDQNGLGIGWSIVETGTLVTIVTRANFEVEGTVDLVLFGAENRGQVVGHFAAVSSCSFSLKSCRCCFER